MTHYNLTDNSVAPRTKGNKQAIEAIINSGHVFLGRINIPVIDIRHYLEDKLDMHHISASLSTRARIKQAEGLQKINLFGLVTRNTIRLIMLLK